MKVLFTCNRIGTGGAERVLCNYSNRMLRDGHAVRLVCIDVLDDFYYPLDRGIQLIQLYPQYESNAPFLRRKISGIRNFVRLFRTLKAENPDVVISFYTRQNCYSIIACKLLGIPVIAAERDHFFLQDSNVNHIMRRLFYPLANGFIHQTSWARDYLHEHYKMRSNSIVLPNPIWIDAFPQRQPEQGRVIAVGRLEEQKDYVGLIEMFSYVHRRVPDAQLFIYGEGSQRQALENQIHILGLDGIVRLPGMTHNVIDCYITADVFVLFSHGEGYPNVLMEALAIGVPCVAYNCPIGGPADMIEDGQNGLLVSEKGEAFAQKVVQLLVDDALKQKLSNNAIKIRQTNQFDHIYGSLMQFVSETIGKKSKACE